MVHPRSTGTVKLWGLRAVSWQAVVSFKLATVQTNTEAETYTTNSIIRVT